MEGDAGLIRRARENAQRNDLANVEFHAADLATDLSAQPWMRAGFDLPTALVLQLMEQPQQRPILQMTVMGMQPVQQAVHW